MYVNAAASALRLYRGSMLTVFGVIASTLLIPFIDLGYSASHDVVLLVLALAGAGALVMLVALVQFTNASPGLGRYVVASVALGGASVGSLFAANAGSRWSPDTGLLALSAVFSAAAVFVFNLMWLKAADRLSLWHLQSRLWGALALAVFGTLVTGAQRLGANFGLLALLGLAASVVSAGLLWHTLGQLQRTLECRVSE